MYRNPEPPFSIVYDSQKADKRLLFDLSNLSLGEHLAADIAAVHFFDGEVDAILGFSLDAKQRPAIER